MPEPLHVVRAPFPDHIELAELVHYFQTIVGQRKHPLAARIFFENHIFHHQPISDNGRIRFNHQRESFWFNGFGLEPDQRFVQRQFQGIELGLVVGAMPKLNPAAARNRSPVEQDLK